ncbi:MAG: ABC transporter permease [Candidatus Roizmanbacteria bacterium]|nr:ABC transporter permease [Candidatus Roizmanbacteria bacterium]
MKRFWFYVREGIEDLKKNKGRSFLTSLGIIIGVYSVVLLLALGEGIKVYIQDTFESLGSNIIYVLPFKIENGPSGASSFNVKQFQARDYLILRTQIKDSLVVPLIDANVQAVSGSETVSTQIVGGTRDMFFLLNLTLEKGRYFSESESVSSRKVVVIGPDVAEKLFGKRNPIGERVTIDDLPFTILGVLEPKGGGGLGGPSLDLQIYAPYKTVQQINGNKFISAFYVQPSSDTSITAVVSRIETIMSRDRNSDELGVSTQEELIGTISSIFAVINTVLIGIAAISLLVGGIGITNIMYVTVTERTREIGIRRAIGAQKHDIMLQFLALSLLLTGVGGGIGLLLAYLSTLAIRIVFPATITPIAPIIAFGVSFAIGLVFGVLPARKAANLSPLEAIRSE